MPTYLRHLLNRVNIDRKEIREEISDNARLSSTYIFLLSSATILSTLGLLLDSPAPVIGAMIISPLTWPILRLAYGIASVDYTALFKGLRLLAVSVGLILLGSFFLTKILPLNALTDQITSRTTPTILDLIIALVAGAIAALTLINKKISKTAAGVAIAASLLPPMCVGGIGLALGMQDITFGGILLSTTNIIAILFVSAILLAIFIKADKEDLLVRRKAIFAVTIVLVIIAIPLLVFFEKYTQKVVQPDEQTKVRTIISDEIDGAYVQTVKISPDTITAVVFIPNESHVSATLVESIETTIEQELKKEYKFDFHFTQEIPIAR